MASVQRVLIVGGGIGGLSLAVSLRNRSIDADIVEIKTNWTVYGVGIIQQANVVRAMGQLGLLDSYLEASFPFESIGLYRASGDLIAMIPSERLAGPNYPANLGISRPALHQVLTKAAIEKQVNVRLGVTVGALQQTRDKVTVTFMDGTKDEYDLVVGADGAYSKIRGMIFPDAPRPRFTGQATWRYNFPRDPQIDHLASFYGPNGQAAGLVPLANDLMYMFVVSAEPGNPRLPAEKLDVLMRDRIQGFGGILAELKERITDAASVVYKPLEVLLLPNPWFSGRVVLIGDAAHTTTPHLGQGAGMAIEDAVALGEELDSDDPIEQQLSRFMDRRFERCKFIVEASEQIGKWQLAGVQNADVAGVMKKMIEVTAQPI